MRFPVTTLLIAGPFIITAIPWFAGASNRECNNVPYQLAEDAASRVNGLRRVVVASGDFTVNNLLCVARMLAAEEGGGEETVGVFFSSRAAAEEFYPQFGESSPKSILLNKEVRAAFLKKPNENGYLELMPLGFNSDAAFNTKIDLTDESTAACRFSYQRRCLLRIDDFDDDVVQLRGSVRLSARLASTGHVADVGVLNVRSDSQNSRATLAEAALRNVKVLWFEPSVRSDRVEIEFVFGESKGITGKEPPDCEIETPNKVVVRVTQRPR
jgi:hypothetical protein